MSAIQIVDALAANRAADAARLVFEYMAMTEGECGRSVPARVEDLPPVLSAECRSLPDTYVAPGLVLLASVSGEAVGVVGLKHLAHLDSLEVKRFYVRRDHRGLGYGRALLRAAHARAAAAGVARTVLDVMPDRAAAVEFYRRAGYRETAPYQALTYPMVVMGRDVVAGAEPGVDQVQTRSGPASTHSNAGPDAGGNG